MFLISFALALFSIFWAFEPEYSRESGVAPNFVAFSFWAFPKLPLNIFLKSTNIYIPIYFLRPTYFKIFLKKNFDQEKHAFLK